MSGPGSVDSLDRIVVSAVALTTTALAQAQPGLELTLQQWRVIVVLGDRPAPMSISAVSAAIGVTLPATSRQLHRLADRGLIDLSPNPLDRRSIQACLSPAGHELRASVTDFRRRRLVEVVIGLDLDGDVEVALADIADAMGAPTRR